VSHSELYSNKLDVPVATVLDGLSVESNKLDVPVATRRLSVESNPTQRGVLPVDYYAAATGGSQSRL
jgi:hypothetical protein